MTPSERAQKIALEIRDNNHCKHYISWKCWDCTSELIAAQIHLAVGERYKVGYIDGLESMRIRKDAEICKAVEEALLNSPTISKFAHDKGVREARVSALEEAAKVVNPNDECEPMCDQEIHEPNCRYVIAAQIRDCIRSI